MKKIFAAVFYVVFVATATNAESEIIKTKALCFSFNSFTLDSYFGGIGGKIWLFDATTLTASLGGSLSRNQNTVTSDTGKYISTTSSFQLMVGLEHHLNFSNGLSPYVIEAFFDRLSTSRTNKPKSQRISNSLGINAGLGIEYWILPRISFSGQQVLTASYNFAGYDDSQGSGTQNLNFGLGFGASSLILAIYF